jgi:hypothetical protein
VLSADVERSRCHPIGSIGAGLRGRPDAGWIVVGGARDNGRPEDLDEFFSGSCRPAASAALRRSVDADALMARHGGSPLTAAHPGRAAVIIEPAEI